MRAVSDPPDSYTQENRDLNKTSMPYEHVALYVSQAGKDDVEEPQQLKNVHTDEKDMEPTVQPLSNVDVKDFMSPIVDKASKQEDNDGSSPPAKPRAKSASMSRSPSPKKSPPAGCQSPDGSMSRSRSRSRLPGARGGKSRSERPEYSRSKSPSPSKRRGSYTPSRSRSKSPVKRRRTRSYSRSRSKSPDKSRTAARSRRGPSPGNRRRRSRSRSISREKDYRRRNRSRERSRDRGRDRGARGARPDVSQFRKPEKWLLNLFEDSLKEVLETTRLPCNVSKINDCMKRLDPTYNLSETGFPTFSVMCHWFDDVGGLLDVSKQRDSVMLMGSRLERDIVKRLRSPPPRAGGRGRSGRRRGRRMPPGRHRRGSRTPDRNDRKEGGIRGGRRGGDSRSRSPDRRRGKGKGGGDAGGDDRWEMA